MTKVQPSEGMPPTNGILMRDVSCMYTCLQDICSPSDATIHEQRHLVANGSSDGSNHIQGGW